MTTALALAGYAAVTAFVLPHLLRQAAWTARAPRLGVAVWLAAAASVPLSLLFAAVMTAVPAQRVGHGLAHLLQLCAHPHGRLGPPGPLGAALLAAGLTTGRLAWAAVAVARERRRERLAHLDALTLVGRHDRDLDAVVVDYPEHLAYCLPGSGRAPRRLRARETTVITTAALARLEPAQVAAVLAHERAHLRGRHHLLLAAVEALARAFPPLPLFARARAEVARLVELLADDEAARTQPRIHLAAAVVLLATGRAPAFALGAGGEAALLRVRRMLRPVEPLVGRERLAARLTVGALLAGPGAVAFLPAAVALLLHHCHAPAW